MSEWVELIGIVATGIFGVITAIITTNSRIKKEREQDKIDDALREQRQEMKFAQIDKKLDEHNGYAQKFAETHDAIVALSTDVKWIKEELNGKK